MRLQDLPLQRITQEQKDAWQRNAALAGAGLAPAAAAAPPPTQPQFFDLTTNPRPPRVGASTKCTEKHPAWAWDQQTIFISSNNIDPIGNYGASAPQPTDKFHIYRFSQDGVFINQITGTGTDSVLNQEYPAVNHALSRIAFVQSNPTVASSGQLWVLDLSTGQRTQYTGANLNIAGSINNDLVSIQHPSFSVDDTTIAFAAKRQSAGAGEPFNLYVVNLLDKVVRPITKSPVGSGVDCIDPVFQPTGNTITFAANATGVNGGTGDLSYTPTPLRNLRGNGAVDTDHNLFTITAGFGGPSAGTPARQLTTSPADDIEPAYQGAAGTFARNLAWASLGRAGATYDIYWNNGQPEGVDAPQRLFTPDSNANAVPDNRTDERYPTWSAGQPVSNPIDRIAFSSDRQNNIADPLTALPPQPGDTTDIWEAELQDITPPTLFAFNESKGEVLHIANAELPDDPNAPDVGRRVGLPGDTFYFYAKLRDLQAGIKSAWIQIKDPDDHFTDSDGLNGDHKLYGRNTHVVRRTGDSPNFTPTHRLQYSYETDFQNIGATDRKYYNSPTVPDFASEMNATMASYLPGVDDAAQYSGFQFQPPVDGDGANRWLNLHDDGQFPDKVKDDGIWSASWATPNAPSDFYVDLIAYDNAVNPKDPARSQNWIIYDNIWGFSTQPFTSQFPVLYVDDNGAGQKWPRGLKGAFRRFETFRFGTESDVIDRPAAQDPTESHWVQGTDNPRQYSPFQAIPDHGSFLTRAGAQLYFRPGNPRPAFLHRSYAYDIWRVLAKGPIPDAVYDSYLPQPEEQPLNIQNSQTIQRPVFTRAIVWNAPYAGDIFSGAGTILDQATQAQLTRYRNGIPAGPGAPARGGRLMIAGGDIVWALTIDGQVQQQFVTDVLGVQQPYLGDVTGNSTFGFLGSGGAGNLPIDPADGHALPTPLGIMRWYPDSDIRWRNRPPQPWNPAGAPSDYLESVLGTPFEVNDGVRPAAGWSEVYDSKMLSRFDTTNNSKTVFLSASLASMADAVEPQIIPNVPRDNTPLQGFNSEGDISSSMFCWMFTAELAGHVANQEGGAPVQGAFVRAFSGGLVGSAFTDGNGNFKIRGLPPGGWGIQVDYPGFATFFKALGAGTHALQQTTADIRLVAAAPGSISGNVLDKFGLPIGNARIHARLQAPPSYPGQVDFFVTTGANGKYTFPSLLVGDYDVSIDQLPPLFANPTPKFTNPVRVNPAQDTPNTDFEVEGQPGPLTVHVFLQNDDGTQGGPVDGALVTLIDGGGQPIPGLQATTGASGTVIFDANDPNADVKQNVPAGPTTISAFKFGRQEATVTVHIPQESTATLLLPKAVQKELYGIVQRALDNAVIDGTQFPLEIDLKLRISQQVVRSTNLIAPQTTPVNHDYRFLDAQDGAFIVSFPGDAHFLPNQVNVDITGPSPVVAPVLQLQGRDGFVSGTVLEDNSGAAGPAIPGALVELKSEVKTPGTVVATATSGNDGTFRTAAAVPSDRYTVTIHALGFNDVVNTGVFVAGDTDLGQLLMTRTPRGQIYGLVRRQPDLALPTPPVNVEIWTLPSSPFGQKLVTTVPSGTTGTAGPDGQPMNYTIGSTNTAAAFLAAGDYELRVTDPRPQGVRYAALSRQITVAGGQATRIDLDLTPLPGPLDGFVDGINPFAPNPQQKPLAGASVRILRGANLVATLTTDTAGHYATAGDIPAGAYSIQVTAFGYVDGSTNVFVEGPTTALKIVLSRVPPSSISGTVTSKVDGSLIAGVEISLTLADNTIPPDPLPTTLTADTLSNDPSPAHNYILEDNVPPARYVIHATKNGWVAATRTINVDPNVDLKNINFQLMPEHTFGRGLLLISVPYDLSGTDVQSLFDPGSFGNAAYWLTDERRYAIYPSGPAADLSLGKGLFVRFNRASAFTAGNPALAAPDAPFSIPVKTGWNLIGAVRQQKIEWLRVQVQTGDGQIRTMQQAMNEGIILNGLFSYQDGYFRSDFLDPFSGYFMKALQDCTLIVPVDNTVGLVTPEIRAKVARMPAPSIDQVARELGALGLGPNPGQTRTRGQGSRTIRLPGLDFAAPRAGAWIEETAWKNRLG